MIDWTEVAAIIGALVILISFVVWTAKRLFDYDNRLKNLENNPLLKSFQQYVEKEGVAGYISKILSQTKVEKEVKPNQQKIEEN